MIGAMAAAGFRRWRRTPPREPGRQSGCGRAANWCVAGAMIGRSGATIGVWPGWQLRTAGALARCRPWPPEAGARPDGAALPPLPPRTARRSPLSPRTARLPPCHPGRRGAPPLSPRTARRSPLVTPDGAPPPLSPRTARRSPFAAPDGAPEACPGLDPGPIRGPACRGLAGPQGRCWTPARRPG